MTAVPEPSLAEPATSAQSAAPAAGRLIATWSAAAGMHSPALSDLPAAITDPHELEFLSLQLSAERSPVRIRYLLRCADLAPKGAVSLAVVFAALKQLATADCVFLRADAYRRLAELHRHDLRYEMRAKLELRQALSRETGVARARVKALLRRC